MYLYDMKNSFGWVSSQNVPNQIAKCNLATQLRALLMLKASPSGTVLSTELLLAPYCGALTLTKNHFKIENEK
jgi:hypothetical protein